MKLTDGWWVWILNEVEGGGFRIGIEQMEKIDRKTTKTEFLTEKRLKKI